MSKFKGTKGKWKYEHIETDSAMFHCVCKDTEVITFVLGDEIKANALLISKAPEMLEMLQRCLNVNDIAKQHISQDLFNDLEQLIKEATELREQKQKHLATTYSHL